MDKNSGAKPGARMQYLAGIAFLFASVLLAYSSSLNGIWALDDFLLNQPLSPRELIEKTGFRKISFLSFVINQMINPHDALNFRLLNIFIHICNALLVFGLTIITCKLYRDNEEITAQRYYIFIALISSTLFALHPLNINAVAYIIQRMASLSTFFVLLSLLLYIIATKARTISRRVLLYLSTAIFIALGILSKENAVMAAPLLLLYDYIFLSISDKRPFFQRVAVIVPLWFAALLIAGFIGPIHTMGSIILKSFAHPFEPLSYSGWMTTDVYWSPLQHILTEFRVIGRYILLFFLPLPGFLIFDNWGYPVSKGFLEPVTTALSIFFIGALIGFSILKSKKYPFLSFGILWYFMAVSLESFIAIGSDLYFEHRNYLPLAGLCIGLTAQTFFLLREKGYDRRFILWSIFFILSAVLGVLTFERNLIWKDAVTFWSDTAIKAPYNIRASLALGNAYFSQCDFTNAKESYSKTIRTALKERRLSFLDDAFYRLGFMHLQLEEKDAAGSTIDLFEKVTPLSYKLKILKGYYSYINNDFNTAERLFREVLADNMNRMGIQDRVTVYTLLGDLKRDSGHEGEAMTYYHDALNLNHLFPAANHGIARVHMIRGDLNAAEETLGKVLSTDMYNIKALADMAYLSLMKGERVDKARTFAEKAISLNPPFYRPYLIMGTILTVQGHDAAAQKVYSKAILFHAPKYALYFNRAWAYSIRGDKEKQKYYLTELLKEQDVPNNVRNTATQILEHLAK